MEQMNELGHGLSAHEAMRLQRPPVDIVVRDPTPPEHGLP